jgi:hypothetical protein
MLQNPRKRKRQEAGIDYLQQERDQQAKRWHHNDVGGILHFLDAQVDPSVPRRR